MKSIPEATTKDGIKIVGEAPAFLVFQPDGFVYWSLSDAPHPDNKAIYRNLKNVLSEKDEPKGEVYYLATLPTEPQETFATRTLSSRKRLVESLKSGNIEQAKDAMPFVSIAVDYSVQASQVLQLVEKYFSIPRTEDYYSMSNSENWLAPFSKVDNAGYEKACRISEGEAKKVLSEIKTLLQAARKFRLHENRSGTPFRNFDLAHGKFMTSVALLAGKLGRVPTRKEIADSTGDSYRAVGKKLEAIGANWIPRERGPKSKLDL